MDLIEQKLLDDLQTRDVIAVKKLSAVIRKREKQKLPSDQLRKKLEKLVMSSVDKTKSNRIETSHLDIPTILPIAEKADEIQKLIEQNQVVIVAGETGCGKTTQLPKICAKAGFGAKGLIAHTQPRRVAATSVAKRIAEEMCVPLGETVGYAIRFNNKLSAKTRIKLMTDGVLLTEIESDPLLSAYEVIIIDEAHERSLNIDFLLGFLKRILKQRSDLKIIITSATIDLGKFSRCFNNAPIVSVEGRSYPVEIRYRPIEDIEDSEDPLLESIQNAVDECYAESTGNILIFTDGEAQIKSIIRHLKRMNLPQTELLPLYARLSNADQQKIFSSSGKRKIIVSTNVAETSLTVPGIIFVIDPGTARMSRYSQRNKIQQLPIEKISRASADQRKGRCGRIAPGICIRLYSEEDFNQRDEFTSPEIKRTNLSSVALRLKAIGVSHVEDFPFIEPPNERAWKTAFNSLFELNAIDQSEKITDIGKRMSRMPADPQLARILAEPTLTAVNEALIICSLMSVKEVRMRPHDKQQKADQLHKQYEEGQSDILSAIKLWHQLESQKASTSSSQFKSWCQKNLINFLGWLEWRRVYFQLKEVLENEGVRLNSESAHPDEVHQALIPGFITHIFCKTQEAFYQGARGLKVWIHPSSLKFKHGSQWILSAEMIETEKVYARMNCAIQPQWVEKYAEHLLKENTKDPHWRKTQGKVIAYQSKTLFGLPVVVNRTIDYAKVDANSAREIFLTEGLAADQIKSNWPFLAANRSKLEKLSEAEHKQRDVNIRIDKAQLASMYQEAIPQNICNTAKLNQWLKKDFKKRNQQLSFSTAQLSNQKPSDVEDFPSTILVKGVALSLTYTFAPGEINDGVSVVLPENMLSQFDERDFDWLVPGYLEEKILAALKSLPKTTRKALIPLKETAARCNAALKLKAQEGSRFVDELAKVLQRESGQQINATDFDLSNIPNHLKMKFQLVGTSNKSNKPKILSSWPKLKAVSKPTKINKTGKYRAWEFEQFQIETSNVIDGITHREFKALSDHETFVSVEIYGSLEIAAQYHYRGIARLLVLATHSKINKLYNGWPDKNALEKMCLRTGGFKAMFESIAMSLGIELAQGKVNLRKSEFSLLVSQFESKINNHVASVLEALSPIIKLREKVYAQIAGLNQSVFSESIEDIRFQLQSLSDLNKANYGSAEFFEDQIRYHKGILSRIKRIKENYPKEAAAIETWLEWLDWWQSIESKLKSTVPLFELNSTFCRLEEYRLSLFSPGIKTKGGVSAKKLQKEFEQLEAKI